MKNPATVYIAFEAFPRPKGTSGHIASINHIEKAIVQIKPFNKLAFAPGAFLMGDLSENQQIFLSLLLFSNK